MRCVAVILPAGFRTRNLMKAPHLFLWISILAAGPCCGFVVAAESSATSLMKDITPYLQPVGDGHISKIIFSDPKIYVMRSHPGFAADNGQVVQISRTDPSSKQVLCDLGSDSALAKEKGVQNHQPELVAEIDHGVLLLNLVCGRDFPDVGPRKDGVSGNAILFHTVNKTFTNLTKLDGRSQKYMRALHWFPNEGIILLGEYDREDKIVPAPKQGTGKPLCLKASDSSFCSVQEFPEIQRWFELHSGLKKRMQQYTGRSQRAHIKWSISRQNKPGEVIFESAYTGRTIAGLAVFPFNNDLLWASSRDLGTYLVDFEGFFRNRVSVHEAFDCDYQRKKLFLRSAEQDENGEHTYWIFDTDRYARYVQARFR